MIDPLRYSKEANACYELTRPVFCVTCLSTKGLKLNPQIAIKFCKTCPNLLGTNKIRGAALCGMCDASNHCTLVTRNHVRQMIVVGPGLRKKVISRGDGVSFPKTLDLVKVESTAAIYHNGKRISREPAQMLEFHTGLSGRCIHVQILGGSDLPICDDNGTSDPFVEATYMGKTLGMTRVKPRNLNPRWDNETFVVPLEDLPRMNKRQLRTQNGMFKLEMFDYDWASQNDLLGHIELPKSKLEMLTVAANEQAISLPLTRRLSYGLVHVKLALEGQSHLLLRVEGGESLMKINPRYLSNPFAKIYWGSLDDTKKGNLIGKTDIVMKSIDPCWQDLNNEFKIDVDLVLLHEQYLQSKAAAALLEASSKAAAQRGSDGGIGDGGGDNAVFDAFQEFSIEHDSLFDIKLYSFDGKFNEPLYMGKASLSVDAVRKMLPALRQNDKVGVQFNEARFDSFDRSSYEMQVASRRNFYCCSPNYSTRWWYSKYFACFSAGEEEQKDDDRPDVDVEHFEEAKKVESEDEILIKGEGVDELKSDEKDGDGKNEKSNQNSPGMGYQYQNTIAKPDTIGLFGASRIAVLKAFFSSGSASTHAWSETEVFPVFKHSEDDDGEGSNGDDYRGQLIVRLIHSSRGAVLLGIDEGVRTMTLGEKAKVKCRYDYAYNNFVMGGNIPPRSNVVFTLVLKEINGVGGSSCWRSLKRFARHFTSRLIPLYKGIVWCLFAKKKKRRPKLRVVRFMGLPCVCGVDFENMDEDAEGDGEDEQSEGESLMSGTQVDEDDDDQDTGPHHALYVKPDSKMKRHLTPAVKTGAKILWNYNPKITKRSKVSKAAPKRPALENVSEDEGEGEGEGEWNGEHVGEEEREEDEEKEDELNNDEQDREGKAGEVEGDSDGGDD